MKHVTYRGVRIDLPDNISMKCLKQFIDECGTDYSITVQHAINFMSKKMYGLTTNASNQASSLFKKNNANN